ncbi:MAG: hypothetical protein ACREM2_07295 [Vulcanimicrobiaceae bacterium]
MDNLKNLAGGLMGGSDPAAAAGQQVASMDPAQLAGHLQQSLGSMDSSSLGALGQQLLQTFTNHTAFNGDGAAAATAAGTSSAAVASGDSGAIGQLISYAKGNPQILQAASAAFVQHNPQALESMAPGFLQQIAGKFGLGGGGTSS